ncbi:MAG TPA: aminoacyl-tRNA hydrolase, partial [Candidatus Omnitrophota bacterium]|nr:aminoacyl-tRNA hydrolase [Candidatus Omnitrophota bacterium]
LASVIGCIGQDFARLRIGVGSQEPVTDMKDYVLGAFRKEERPVLKEVIEKAVLCVEQWLEFGASKAMAAHNG